MLTTLTNNMHMTDLTITKYTSKEDVQEMIENTLQDDAIVHVEIVTRKIPSMKLFGFIQLYDKVPVYRLMYSTIHGKTNNTESYEEYNSHADIYKRLATQPIYGKSFPSIININEFIDLGFSIKF